MSFNYKSHWATYKSLTVASNTVLSRPPLSLRLCYEAVRGHGGAGGINHRGLRHSRSEQDLAATGAAWHSEAERDNPSALAALPLEPRDPCWQQQHLLQPGPPAQPVRLTAHRAALYHHQKWRQRRSFSTAHRAGRFRRGRAGGGEAVASPRRGPGCGHGHGGRRCQCPAAARPARLRGGVLALLAGARGLRRLTVLRHRRCGRGLRGGGRRVRVEMRVSGAALGVCKSVRGFPFSLRRVCLAQRLFPVAGWGWVPEQLPSPGPPLDRLRPCQRSANFIWSRVNIVVEAYTT